MDTIYAEATPPGRGGVSIVRLSGPDARRIGEELAGPIETARLAVLRAITDGDLIDRGLVIRFEAGSSFTGEEVVEFHLHGAPVVVRRLQSALRAHGARLAEPGEFTRRGFLNGVLTLSDAEALSDLLVAETEGQRAQAMRVVAGELSRWAEDLRAKLVRAGALIEASLDFADEDVPEEVPAEVYALLSDVRSLMRQEIAGYPATERMREGFEVAIVGPPNAGKSSLLNRIARREVALVSDQAGTTRDVIEVRTELGGLAVTFLDTAGLRRTSDHVEQLGIERARERAAAADLRIHLSQDGAIEDEVWRDGDIALKSKADLGGGDVSAFTGQGVDAMLQRVQAKLGDRVAGSGLLSRRRHFEGMQDAVDALAFGEHVPPELLAEGVRVASLRLAELIGRVAPDDFLDEIFSSFCIGK